MKQHAIPNPPPIHGWQMTQGAPGISTYALIGRTIVTTYEIPDEDDRTTLLLLDNGQVLGIGVDIGYHDDPACSRNPDVHELYWFDATDTPAGIVMRTLEPGEWT